MAELRKAEADLNKALYHYQEALNLKPNFSPANISRKRILEKLGRSTRESS